jgi:hypothetical protein
MGEHAGVRRAPCSWAVGKMAPCRAGAAGATEDRGGDDAGAHARHMRRRTSGLRQFTLHPRPISRLSSASSPSFAASNTALSIESLIASAALIRPAPARPPADSGGGHARGSAVTLGKRRRALRRGAHVQLAHTPLGARVAAAAVARGRVEDVRSDHGAQSRLPQRLAPEAPSRWYGVVWVCEAAGSRGAERVRSRPSGSTRALGIPPLALTFSLSVKQPKHSL